MIMPLAKRIVLKSSLMLNLSASGIILNLVFSYHYTRIFLTLKQVHNYVIRVAASVFCMRVCVKTYKFY